MATRPKRRSPGPHKAPAKAPAKTPVKTPVKAPAKSRPAPPALNKDESPVFDEALRRGEDARDRMEHALVEYGTWLLAHVFGGDTSAALEHRRDNAIWMNLLSRAGGRTLKLSAKFLNVAVRIAAYDKRIQSDSWRLLEPARKELLLPLANEGLLREASSHVVDAGLGYEATRSYVANLRSEQGESPKARVTGPRVRRLFSGFRERIEAKAFVSRVGALGSELEGGEKKALKDELRAVRAAIAAVEKKLG